MWISVNIEYRLKYSILIKIEELLSTACYIVVHD